MYGSYWLLPVSYGRVTGQPAEVPAFDDQHKFLRNVLQAIYDERKAQRFYTILIDRANTPFEKRQIEHALEDEIKHERLLTDLYRHLTGEKPQVPQPQTEEVADFLEGLKQAFEDELDAAEMYRNMYLATHLVWVRDVLVELFTDEMEHASRFTFLRAEQ